jgi:fluoroquinolone resistance protein
MDAVGIGGDLRDLFGFGRYIREKILPLAPVREPVAFRGWREDEESASSFFEDLETSLLEQPGQVWNVIGPSGFGKTELARWAAARWGRRFLEDPEGSPVPLWIEARSVRTIARKKRPLAIDDLPRALGVRFPAKLKERLRDLLHAHPFIAIIDRDEGPQLSMALKGIEPEGSLRHLHLSLQETLPGETVFLEPWEREAALLLAHHRLGPEGIRRISALERSPAAALVAYPLFLGHLLERLEAPLPELERDGGVPRFLRELHPEHIGAAPEFIRWCEMVLLDAGLHPDYWRAARRLHLAGPGAPEEFFGRVFRAYLLAELIHAGREYNALANSLLVEADLEIMGRVLESHRAGLGLLQGLRTSETMEATNRLNLQWKLFGPPLPEETLASVRAGVRIPGYLFRRPLSDLKLSDSDLSGVSLTLRRARDCSFSGSSFRQADLALCHFSRCRFAECDFSLADLSKSRFRKCALVKLDLSQAILGGTIFFLSSFRGTRFGCVGKGEEVRFKGSTLTDCSLEPLIPAGLFLEKCVLEAMSFQGLRPASFKGPRASFKHCDFSDFAAPKAQLAGAEFQGCLLSGASLRGADLREARFKSVSFQPGPASRAGLTPESSRAFPLYGSQSGFYAQGLVEGVYGDPEEMRTADLRETDLRGAVFRDTDLFRVDLRRSRLDVDLLALARRMGAYLDGSAGPQGGPDRLPR